jgi:ribonuclease E
MSDDLPTSPNSDAPKPSAQIDSPVDQRANSATGSRGGSEHDPVIRPRRRRGTRGGSRNGSKSSNGRQPGSERPNSGPADLAGAERNPELPDLPWEGVPGGRDAASISSSETNEPINAPKVGDSRESISTVTAAAGSGPDAATAPVSRERRQQQSKQSKQARGPKQPQPAKVQGPKSENSDDEGKSEQLPGGPKLERAEKPEKRERPEKTGEGGASGNGENGARARSRRTSGRDARTKRAPINPNAEYTMCVHVRSNATQIAVLEGRTLIEHYVSHAEDDVSQIHGNIYLGKVQNVLPGMEAAFVDIATPKNAVLYRGDVQFDRKDLDSPAEFKETRIEQLLKNGQLVLCQVTKNPIAAKGARLTQEVSMAGRFVVLVPNSSTYGISKRLPDDERKRLRSVLDQVKPAHHGIIVRTAAAGADADELRRDVQSLVKHWDEIATRAAKLRGPALLHREPNLAVRIIREEFSAAYQRVVIDDVEVYQEVRRYVESITPELANRIELFDTSVEPLPVFEKFHVHEQLHKAIDRKVWLPSGGSIIIERTEALTVIDVNTGKNVGSTSLEETVYRNNLEAATEVARQLRLRDIGGIIVIDFIDMEIKPNRAAVVAHFRNELSKDKTRTQVFEISDLGLVEMTRKRISEGLIEALSDTCPTCHGRGFVFDPNVLEE